MQYLQSIPTLVLYSLACLISFGLGWLARLAWENATYEHISPDYWQHLLKRASAADDGKGGGV